MKIFFIRPKPGDSPFSTNEKRPPIGIAYLLSILKGIGCDVKFVDMYIGEKCNIMDIVNYNPDFIGMYCDTITFPEAIKTLKLLEYIRHDFNCDFKIMVGGPHATLRPQDFPGFVDYIVQGEGEEAIADIVKGKVKDRIIKYPYIKDLNLLPMPDYKELFKHNYDLTAPEIDARKVMVMNTSRGCPYRCLVGSFKVFTPKGNKLIQQLKSQDKIISWDFRKKSFKTNEILEINKQITKKYLRIIYEHNGKDKVLRVTENHKIHTKRGWINAIDLTENDEILIIECSDKISETKKGNRNPMKRQSVRKKVSLGMTGQSKMKWCKIKRIENKKRVMPIYDIICEDKPHNFFADNVLVHNCNFCSAWQLWGKKYRYMDAEKVILHIKYLKEKYNIDGIYFREDNFIANKERTKEFCKSVKSLNIKWKCEARVNNLTEDVVKMIAEAGCKALYIGVESGNQRVLNLMQKDIKVEDTKRAFADCKKYGIKTYASVIAGFPGETSEELMDTHKLLNEIKPYQIWWNVFTGLPGSESYNEMTEYYKGEYGMRYPLNWDKLADIYYGKGISWRVRNQNYKLIKPEEEQIDK